MCGTAFFVASLGPSRQVLKTWWRVPIDEVARKDPGLEVFLPEKAALSELQPNILIPRALPTCGPASPSLCADVVGVFLGWWTVTVQREGYEDMVGIPACSQAVVEAAITDAVQQGILWLVNGPASSRANRYRRVC